MFKPVYLTGCGETRLRAGALEAEEQTVWKLTTGSRPRPRLLLAPAGL